MKKFEEVNQTQLIHYLSATQKPFQLYSKSYNFKWLENKLFVIPKTGGLIYKSCKEGYNCRADAILLDLQKGNLKIVFTEKINLSLIYLSELKESLQDNNVRKTLIQMLTETEYTSFLLKDIHIEELNEYLWEIDDLSEVLTEKELSNLDYIIKCLEADEERNEIAEQEHLGIEITLSNCLATTNPELSEEWDATRNGDSTPYGGFD